MMHMIIIFVNVTSIANSKILMSNQYFQYKGFYTFSYELILIRIKVHVINAFLKSICSRDLVLSQQL